MDLQRKRPTKYTFFFLNSLSPREKCFCWFSGRARTWSQQTHCLSLSFFFLSPYLTYSPLHPSVLTSKKAWPEAGKLETMLLHAESTPTKLPAQLKHWPARGECWFWSDSWRTIWAQLYLVETTHFLKHSLQALNEHTCPEEQKKCRLTLFWWSVEAIEMQTLSIKLLVILRDTKTTQSIMKIWWVPSDHD